jgi:hypothetical protein
MPAEMTGWSKFAKAMTNHILGHVNRYMAPSIMDCDGVAHHLGEDRAIPAPGADDLFLATRIHGFDSL